MRDYMRHLSFVLGALLAAPAFADGQDHRYVPIPFEGNFETLFKDRLRSAKEIEPLQRILDQMKRDPAKFKVDPAILNKINLEDPAIRSLIDDIKAKHADTPEFAAKL